MQTVFKTLSKHPYLSEIALIAIFASFATYTSVIFFIPPSPWNALWMMAIPVVVGVALNKGVVRIVMAVILLVVSLIVTSIVGNAMGGI